MDTTDKKQLYIFDIDSALDHLENELNEENTVAIQSQQNTKQDFTLKSATELKVEEENGNISTSINHSDHDVLISANEEVTSISSIDNNNKDDERK